MSGGLRCVWVIFLRAGAVLPFICDSVSCELGLKETTEPTGGTQHREYWGGPANGQPFMLGRLSPGERMLFDQMMANKNKHDCFQSHIAIIRPER